MVNALVLLLLITTSCYSCLSTVYSSWTDNYSDCRTGVNKASTKHSFTENSTLKGYAENAMANKSKGYRKYIIQKYGTNICSNSKLVTKAETFSLNSHIVTSHGMINGCQTKWDTKITKWNLSNAKYGCAYRRNSSTYRVLCIYCV